MKSDCTVVVCIIAAYFTVRDVSSTSASDSIPITATQTLLETTIYSSINVPELYSANILPEMAIFSSSLTDTPIVVSNTLPEITASASKVADMVVTAILSTDSTTVNSNTLPEMTTDTTHKLPDSKITVTCNDPGEVANATRFLSGTSPHDIVLYTCDSGTIESGNSTRVCQDDGKWDGEQPVCITPKGCPEPEITPGTSLNMVGHFIHGDEIRYTCDYGHKYVAGDMIRRCEENDTWSGDTPFCGIIECEMPQRDSNTHTIPYTRGVNFGNTVYYMCEQGYVYQSGSLTRTCQEDGTWDGSQPFCGKEMSGIPESLVADTQCYTMLQKIYQNYQNTSWFALTSWTFESFIQLLRSKGIDGQRLKECIGTLQSKKD